LGFSLGAYSKEATTQAEASMPVPEERKRDIEESWFMIKFRFETNPNKVLLTPSNQ
jgi:hypothetical protein